MARGRLAQSDDRLRKDIRRYRAELAMYNAKVLIAQTDRDEMADILEVYEAEQNLRAQEAHVKTQTGNILKAKNEGTQVMNGDANSE